MIDQILLEFRMSSNLITSQNASLPSVENAKLPATYEAARTALAHCSRIDECKDWADKMAALASYAKQAKNEELLKYCMRIQARASRRCGELLKQIESVSGARTDLGPRDDCIPRLTRAESATESGLSEQQRKTVLRVASIKESVFNAAVESDNPPTVSKLAEVGRKKKPEPLIDLRGIPPADYARATEARGNLRRFAEFCKINEPTRIAKAFMSHEIVDLRNCVATVDEWLDKFITNLAE